MCRTIPHTWITSKKHDERMLRFAGADLYLVTSEKMSVGRGTLEIVQAALAGGISLFQLREKELTKSEFLKLAVEVKKQTDRTGAILLVNDHLDVAMSIGADGVHLGQNDMPVNEARELAPDLIIGASSHSVREAVKAQEDGASYVNIGPIFATNTKEWTDDFLGVEAIKEISSAITIPFTVMGGIKKRHIPELLAGGARIVALVTAVTAAEDPEQAARDLLSCWPKNRLD